MQVFRFILLPLSFVYWLAVKVRNLFFDINLLKGYSPDLPTICIGNITVGGTGKTPHSEYLIDLLQNQYKVGLLSRGYRRTTTGFKLVGNTSTVKEVGDEPLQIKLKYPNTVVAVDEDRVNGTNELIYRFPEMDVLLLDDAFQHRYIKPGLSLLLTDFNNLITRDFFLPVGNLRDSISEKRRAQIVIVTKCPPDLSTKRMNAIRHELRTSPDQTIYFTCVQYGKIKPIFNNAAETVEINNTLNVFALAGIANTHHFFDYTMKNFQSVGNKSYPDHHHFTEKEIKSIFGKFLKNSAQQTLVVTTEKDAARIRCLELEPEYKNRLYYLSISINFLNNDAVKFNKQILNYVGEN